MPKKRVNVLRLGMLCKEFNESLGLCIKTKKFKLDVFFECKLHFNPSGVFVMPKS